MAMGMYVFAHKTVHCSDAKPKTGAEADAKADSGPDATICWVLAVGYCRWSCL